MLNKLLQRQVQKYLGGSENIPENMAAFLQVISESYDHYEKDRNMLERSIDLTSTEMVELNDKLRKEAQELKQAQQKLEAANKELNRLFNNIHEVLFSVDMTSARLIQMSDACKDIYGYTPEEFYANADLWQSVIYPEDRSVAEAHIQTLFLGKQVQNQYRIIHKDGSIRWIENSIIPTIEETGRLVRLDGITTDITERKQSEDQLYLLNKELQKRAEELANSNTELERFAFVASHDLQEPLRMVSSFLQLLKRKYQDRIDDTGNKYIHIAVEGAERMKQLISDLLQYSRVGTSLLEIARVDMNEVMDEVLLVFNNGVKRADAEFIIDKLPVIEAGKTAMTQLLQNLVGNALKYRSDRKPVIKVSATEDEDFWTFYVQDNGIGIDPRFAEKIFIVFQRLHNKDEYSGTGIGLAICKKIVERYKGKIWVESEPEKGSKFVFTIAKHIS